MKVLLKVLILFPFTYAGANGQTYDSTLFDGMRMRQIGPAAMSGRVTSIDVQLTDPSIIYIGTASGGLWKSTSGGTKWFPVFDENPILSIGAVAITQSNPDIIWAGTGEGNPRNSQSSGAGIYKSIDGGRSWKLMGLEKTKTIHRIIVDKNNPDVVYVAAMGSAWGSNEERGVYKTTDGGQTWEKNLFVNDLTGCADLIVDPSNPNKLIAAMWEYHRQPWFFTSGGEGSGLYLTYDGGKNWKRLDNKNGLPKGQIGRCGLAIAQNKPNVVYALIESKKTGLYRSNNGGENWMLMSNKNVGNRPFYYADIYVDPQNENRIYNLYSIISKSEDAGKTFQPFAPYFKVHPDHHAFWVHPENPDFIIEGNDGGVNISRDGGKTWRFSQNLPVAQFYHINYDLDIPYNVYGGMQDNGSWVGPSEVWRYSGIHSSDWQEVLFGDGFDVMPKAGHSRYGYAMYQGGALNAYDRETGRVQMIKPVLNDTTELRFSWNAALAQNPHNPCGIYFGSQFVHRSDDCGLSWMVISPDLTTNDTSKQNQVKSGGLTIDATKAENYTTITTIAPSPIDQSVIWVGTDDGNVWITTDGGKEWDKLNNKLDNHAPSGAWVAQIVPSKHNAEEAFIIVNDYRRNDWEPYAVHATKYGKKMVSLITNRIQGHCLSIEQDHVAEDLLFLGTEQGLYFSTNLGAEWTKWTNHYPSVSTIDLKIHPREGDLIIGTFGRAAYILDDIKPLRELALTKNKVLDQDIDIFSAPDAYLVGTARPPGTRFRGDAMFSGDNDSRSAAFSYYLKSLHKTDDKKKRKDEDEDEEPLDWKNVYLHIINVKGDTMRSFHRPADTGFSRIYWNLRVDGYRFPTQEKLKEGDNLPSGRPVIPGNYKAVLVYGTYKDSANVAVKPDPRDVYVFNHVQRKNGIIDEFSEYVKAATQAYDFLMDVEAELTTIIKRSELMSDSTAAQVMRKTKAIQKTINGFKDRYALSPDFEGYNHVSVFLTDRIGSTIGYLDSSPGIPGPNAMLLKSQVEEEIRTIVDEINTFMKGEWNDYKLFVLQTTVKLFKDNTPINIKR